jgi:hypothetical protein
MTMRTMTSRTSRAPNRHPYLFAIRFPKIAPPARWWPCDLVFLADPCRYRCRDRRRHRRSAERGKAGRRHPTHGRRARRPGRGRADHCVLRLPGQRREISARPSGRVHIVGSYLPSRQPSVAISCSTRPRISSRISRTRGSGFDFGSSSGQSSRFTPGTTGHSSPHPIVIST